MIEAWRPYARRGDAPPPYTACVHNRDCNDIISTFHFADIYYVL